MLPNEQTGHIRVADSAYIRIICHRHVPLVKSLIILYCGMLLSNVADKSSDGLISDHVGCIKASSITETPQLKLNVLEDRICHCAGCTRCSVPSIHTLSDITVLVNPTLIRFIAFKLNSYFHMFSSKNILTHSRYHTIGSISILRIILSPSLIHLQRF